MNKISKEPKVRELDNSAIEENLLFNGLYEKYLRRKLGYSLQNISSDLSISKGNLSEMENGIRIMKDELFISFLDRYNLEFEFSKDKIRQTQDFLKKLYEAFLYLNTAEQTVLAKQWKAHKDSFRNSYAFFYYIFINSWITVIAENETATKDLEFLLDNIIVLPASDQALLLFLKGMNERLLYHHSEMDDYFEQSLITINRNKSLSTLESLIFYYQIQGKIRKKQILEGYNLCLKTLNRFYPSHNLIRILYLQNMQVNCLLSLREYTKALELITFLEDQLYLVQRPYLVYTVVQNIILAYCLKGDYQKAYQFGCSHYSEQPYEIGNFTLLPFCSYMLNDLKQTEYWTSLLLPIAKSKDDLLFLKLIESLVQDSKIIQERSRLLFKEVKNIRNHEIEELSYRVLIHYYSKNNQTELLNEIKSRYLSFLLDDIPLS